MRIAQVASLTITPLLGCVSLPVADHLILNGNSAAVRIHDAGCENRWLELPSTSKSTTAGLEPAGFNLMTWNIFKAQEDAWPEDFVRLSAGQDLILLQEAHLTRPFRETLGQTGYRWFMARAFDYRGAETGVLTASLVPAEGACIDRTQEPLLRAPKSALLTQYALDGESVRLLVANLHGINFTLGTSAFEDQLESAARVLETHPGPLIMAGDFNDWSERRSRILHSMTTRLDLIPLIFVEDGRTRYWGQPVDHVFYRGLKLMHAESIIVSSSDHNPIFARFRLPRPSWGGN